MKIKKPLIIFLTVFLIFISAVTKTTKAIPVSSVYKQGIYNISQIKEFNATAKLITPQNVTSLIIIDCDNNQKFYKRFDIVNEVINLGTIKDGDIISIVGSGEIAISFSR